MVYLFHHPKPYVAISSLGTRHLTTRIKSSNYNGKPIHFPHLSSKASHWWCGKGIATIRYPNSKCIGINVTPPPSPSHSLDDDVVGKRSGVERKKAALSMAALAMCLCNADRVIMSVAVAPLAASQGWPISSLGVVQSSFLWGYLVSSVAGGALADRYGGERVMRGGVAAWSLATFLTPWAAHHSMGMLLLFRVLFGLAQGVAIPSLNIIIARQFASGERATAMGICMGAFHVGNMMGLLSSPLLMASLGIPVAFAIYAALGLLLLSAWPPSDGGDQDNNKLSATAGHNNIGLCLQLLSKLPSWAIILANFTNNWGYFVLLSWMPLYFKTVFDVNLKEAAWFSAIPWGLMAISSYGAGLCSDRLIDLGISLTVVRKIMQSIGFIGPGVALLCLNYARMPSLAAALLTVALGLSSFSQAGFLLNIQDVAPRCAGLLHGISNSFGTLAAIISTIGTGYFVERVGSFQGFLTLTSFLYFAATFFWVLNATADPLVV